MERDKLSPSPYVSRCFLMPHLKSPSQYPSVYHLHSSLLQLPLDVLAEVRVAQQGKRGLQLDGHRLGGLQQVSPLILAVILAAWLLRHRGVRGQEACVRLRVLAPNLGNHEVTARSQ